MPIPRKADDMAFFELGGIRYIVLPLGPTPTLVEKKNKDTLVSAPTQESTKKDAVDVVHASAAADTKKYVYGLKGISTLFGCSKSTAYKIKRSGRIDEAISQIGSTIIVDAEKALELLKNK